MISSRPNSNRPTRSGRLHKAIIFAVALPLLFSLVSCRTMWDQVRERERLFALKAGRSQAGRGQCTGALQSLDRSQSRIDLGAYSRESTVARARCYDKIGFVELATAHRRMVDDFYTEEPMAYPSPDGGSVFRVKTVPSDGFSRPPSWLKIPSPRYTPYAQRSKIVGRVVVSFEIAGNDQPRRIRVLEMPHPLLATWAVEAIGSSKSVKKKDTPITMPGGRYVTTFVFQWRWAKEAETEPLDS